ncbi:MAG: hypothetical protein ACE5FE_01545, partial [Acidiferrobacterales bacterium]
ANAPAARVAPGRVLRVLERAVADAEAWQGPRGDADATLEALHALTGHPRFPCPPRARADALTKRPP